MPANPGILDSGHVVLTGPTPKTVTVTPGSTVTISGLDVGTYTVRLVGFYGGGAAYTAQISGVTVVAGQNTTPAVPALVASFGVTVTPPTGSIAAGATQQFTAVAKDAQGNTISPITFFWASSNQNAALVDQTGLATGVAGGTTTISALGLGVPGSAALTVGTVVPTQLAFSTQPTSSTAGAAISPAVEVEERDASGNRVTTARDAVTLAIANNAGGGTLSGTVTVNAVNGVASFSGLSIDKAGTGYTLASSSGSLTGATSSAINISPAVAAKLKFSAQPPANVEGNVAFAATVQITDNFGNVVTTATDAVTLEIGRRAPFGQNAKLLGATQVSAVAGVAAFAGLRVDIAGAGYTLNASAGGLQGTTSAGVTVKLTFVQVEAGYNHTCGVTASGSAYCWGNNGSGQLGLGTFSSDSVPRLVSGGFIWSNISAGGNHTCGVTTTKALYCWGFNGNGRLGVGSTGGSFAEPQLVASISGKDFARVSAGGNHTCATTTTAGTTTPNAAYCWGYDGYGQLGDGALADQNVPTLVAAGLNWKQIYAGDIHTCAVRDNDLPYCWGYNGNGQLAIGSTVNQNTPQQASAVSQSQTPTGGYHSCFRKAVSPLDIFCAGYNGYGQLGDGTNVDKTSAVTISSQLAWSDVALGFYHTCMIDGATLLAYCVGYGGSGQLGNGATANQNVRVAVNGSHLFTGLTGGAYHTCGVNSANGEVWCWGNAGSGQLGNGSRVIQSTPVQLIQ